MASQIHLVRHAEAVHNITKDFSEPDPALTPLGLRQATNLTQTLAAHSRVAVVYTSPLRRAIQTALVGFRDVLDKRYYPSSSREGIENGAQLVIDSNLQECSALGCDTGSDRETLEKEFPTLDFNSLANTWPSKEGIFSPDDQAVEERAKQFRERLAKQSEESQSQQKGDVVVVTHGVFMKVLCGDASIDLPKAGWKSFVVEKGGAEGSVLVPVAAPG